MSDSWGESHQRGDALLQAGRWQEAADAYDEVIRSRPEATVCHVNMGHALCHLGRWTEAAAAYAGARDLDPSVLGVCANLGDALMRAERWAEAVTPYEEAIREAPDDCSIRINLGHTLMHLERWEDAVGVFRAAIAQEQGKASWHANLAEALFHLNRWAESADEYRRARELDPSAAGVCARLADASTRSGRWEDSISAYRQTIRETLEGEPGADETREAAFERAQNASRLYRELGDALCRLHRWEEASAAVHRANQLNPLWSRAPIGPMDAHIEAWVSGGWSEPTEPPSGPRLMFVMDSDYGELTTVMFFLFAQGLAARSTLLLSERLFLHNRHVLPGRTHPATSREDVVRAVDREKPEIVFLCSAYLFSLHGVMSLDELDELVPQLKSRGCRVVTTDPFLGLLSNLGTSTTVSVDIPADASADLVREKQKQDERLLTNFFGSSRIVADLEHLYPTYPAALDAEAASDARVLSFFNSSLVCPDGPTGPGASETASAERPRWLFILASRDYEAQIMIHGKERFVDTVIHKIHATLDAGRHPVFVAPYDLVQAVIAKMPPTDGVTLLTFCPFKKFLTLLIDAEFAFYWNVVSHSMLLRLMNRQPFFMFDRGHLVRNVTPLYERVVEWYYQGREPTYLSQDQRLDLAELTEQARADSEDAERVARGFARAPAPAEMLARVLRNRPAKSVSREQAQGSIGF